MRRRLAGHFALVATAGIILIVSVLLLGYANWLRGIAGGNRALSSGDAAGARQMYDAAARRIGLLPLPGKLLPDGYRELVFNRVRALYAEDRDDVLTRFLEAEAAVTPRLADDAEYHFWLGNVQFRKALAQKEKQQTQSGLQQAVESYRRALATSPDDWDIKYNYELSARLLERLRKGKDDDLEKMKRGQMKLLRDEGEKKQEQQRQIAPEKRG
jgi:tetratricopeptide (TPR) repeat protein